MRNRFQINEELILALVGNNGGTWKSEEEVRAYFTRDNLRDIFPGGRMLPQESLDELAELVVEYRTTSARFLWDAGDL